MSFSPLGTNTLLPFGDQVIGNQVSSLYPLGINFYFFAMLSSYFSGPPRPVSASLSDVFDIVLSISVRPSDITVSTGARVGSNGQDGIIFAGTYTGLIKM